MLDKCSLFVLTCFIGLINRLYCVATFISEVYEAFRSAGVPEDQARAAVAALSEHQHATRIDIARLRWQLLVIKWMLGVATAIAAIWLIRSLLA